MNTISVANFYQFIDNEMSGSGCGFDEAWSTVFDMCKQEYGNDFEAPYDATEEEILREAYEDPLEDEE